MYYFKRILKALFSMYIIATLSFLIISLIPGNPAISILGIDAPAQKIELFNKNFGLDKPIFDRYFIWLKNILKGDLGISLKYQIPVKSLVMESLPITMSITFISLIITVTISIILSFYLIKTRNKIILKIFDVLLGVFISIPSFCIALLFILLFSVKLRWFSLSYNGSINSLIWACIVISVPKMAMLTYNLRENLYKEIREEYIKYLFSNGMKMKYLNMYVLKNSIISVLPIMGLIFIDLITGIVIIEQVFSIPGIGRLIMAAVYSRDVALVQGLIIYTSFCVVIVNILIDVLYSIMDKRVRLGGKL